MRLAVVVILMAGMAGCAVDPPAPPRHTSQLAKIGASNQELAKDRFDCQKEATLNPPLFHPQPVLGPGAGYWEKTDEVLYSNCLQARGWVWQ